MLRVIVSRLLGSLAALVGASIVAFLVLRALPGDPARAIYGRFATPQYLSQVRQQLGLDEPLYTQYWKFVTSLVKGNWGYSFNLGEPVSRAILPKLAATGELALSAFGLAIVGAVSAALLSVRYRTSVLDSSLSGLALVVLGLPVFWFGLLLLLAFSVHGGLPLGGRLSPDTLPPPKVTGFFTVDAILAGQWATLGDAVEHLILPAVTLAAIPCAYLFRLLRANLLEAVREPFIVVVRSKGVGRWRAIWRHALPNALLPSLTASGLVLAELVGGAVLVETVFTWPGIGELLTTAIFQKDFAVAQVVIVLIGFTYIVVNAVVDILYGVIDPRIRRPAGQA
jgi:ABC-type dipeptide/oligopeptide/nickel transport system permease component